MYEIAEKKTIQQEQFEGFVSDAANQNQPTSRIE
jgi:hypothetical protein